MIRMQSRGLLKPAGALAIFVALTSIRSLAAPPQQIFVSPAGDDAAGDGSRKNPYATIQTGIDAATTATLEVIALPGDYLYPDNKEIRFHGKAITVRSENGPGSTRILHTDTTITNRAFVFDGNETRASILDGFTIRGFNVSSYVSYEGSPIVIRDSSPTVRNCILENNSSWSAISSHLEGAGGGISIRNASPLISRCVIRNNIVTRQSDRFGGCVAGFGGGLAVAGGGAPIIEDCAISGNMALAYDTPTVTPYCTSDGGGIHISGANTKVIRCSIVENEASQGGGIMVTDGGSLHLEDSTVALNTNVGVLMGPGALGSTIRNATIVANTPLSRLGGTTGGVVAASNTAIWNSIVAYNSTVDVGGNISSLGYNIIQSTQVAFNGPGDQTGIDPLLGPRLIVGFYQTIYMPMPGSPAIDSVGLSPTLDQLGRPRTCDGDNSGAAAADIGAVEFYGDSCLGHPGEILDFLLGRTDAGDPSLDRNGDQAIDIADLQKALTGN